MLGGQFEAPLEVQILGCPATMPSARRVRLSRVNHCAVAMSRAPDSRSSASSRAAGSGARKSAARSGCRAGLTINGSRISFTVRVSGAPPGPLSDSSPGPSARHAPSMTMARGRRSPVGWLGSGMSGGYVVRVRAGEPGIGRRSGPPSVHRDSGRHGHPPPPEGAVVMGIFGRRKSREERAAEIAGQVASGRGFYGRTTRAFLGNEDFARVQQSIGAYNSGPRGTAVARRRSADHHRRRRLDRRHRPTRQPRPGRRPGRAAGRADRPHRPADRRVEVAHPRTGDQVLLVADPAHPGAYLYAGDGVTP